MDQSVIIQLVIRTQKRDSAAFTELVGHTQRFAYGTVFRITGNAEESRDIVQEAYIRVWTRISSYNGKVPFQAWFFTILRNLSLDWLRKNHFRPAPEGDSLLLTDNHNPGTELEAAELNRLISHWTGTLPETQQLVFMLRDMDGLSIREVQDQTGLTESSIKSNLFVARKKLAAYLKLNGYLAR